jgi:PadR family transcriptional regulator, regulatory protein PadR
MGSAQENWKTQIRKGYLELCILLLIRQHGRLYGLELLDLLDSLALPVKEGTLYPLLNRMTTEGHLRTEWETEQLKGHPRKFYSLNRGGEALLAGMVQEFTHMTAVFERLQKSSSNEAKKGK